MGISDMIAKKKAQFFGASSTNKVELMKEQRKVLAKEREQREVFEKERLALKKEKDRIHELKMAPKRERRATVVAGFNRLSNATKKANAIMKKVDAGVSKFAPGKTTDSRVIKPSGIFAEPIKKKEKPKVKEVRVRIIG